MLDLATQPTVNPATIAAASALIAAVNPTNDSLGRALERARERLLQREWTVNAEGHLRIESWEQPGTFHLCSPTECDHPSRERSVCWHRASWLILGAISAAALGPIINADGTIGGLDPYDDLDWSLLDEPPPPAPLMTHNPQTALDVAQAAPGASGIYWDANGALVIPDKAPNLPAKAPEKAQDAPNAPDATENTAPVFTTRRSGKARDPESEALKHYRKGQKMLMTDAELERRRKYKPTQWEIDAAAAEMFGDEPPGATYTPPAGVN